MRYRLLKVALHSGRHSQRPRASSSNHAARKCPNEIEAGTARCKQDVQRLNQPNFPAARSQQRHRRHPRRYWPPCLAALALACSDPAPIYRTADSGQDVTIDAGTDADADAAATTDAAANSDADTITDAAANSDADTSPDADANPDAEAIPDAEAPTAWCSVQAILAAKCQRCHGSPATHGAPFPLVDYADTQALDRKGRARFERIAVAVEQGTMPAEYIKLKPPVEPLQDEERMIVLSWCAQGGMLTGSASCDPAP
jgi:hypothetical protein